MRGYNYYILYTNVSCHLKYEAGHEIYHFDSYAVLDVKIEGKKYYTNCFYTLTFNEY